MLVLCFVFRIFSWKKFVFELSVIILLNEINHQIFYQLFSFSSFSIFFYLWESMRIFFLPARIYEDFFLICENLWKSSFICENLWESSFTCENLWQSFKMTLFLSQNDCVKLAVKIHAFRVKNLMCKKLFFQIFMKIC